MDQIAAAMDKERNDRLPYVYPKKFYHKYRDNPDGTKRSEEWVIVAKKGMTNPQETPMRWRDVERTPLLHEVLAPYHANWKRGNETPVNGTPLEAWTAEAEMVEVLNSVNVRSVEDFAELADHLLMRLNIPGSREKQKRARAFLDARSDTAKVSAEVAELRSKNEALVNTVNELKALIEQHAIKQETVKRGPGRPRKQLEVAN